MGLINELGGQPYSFIHTSFTAIGNVRLPGGSSKLDQTDTLLRFVVGLVLVLACRSCEDAGALWVRIPIGGALFKEIWKSQLFHATPAARRKIYWDLGFGVKFCAPQAKILGILNVNERVFTQFSHNLCSKQSKPRSMLRGTLCDSAKLNKQDGKYLE